MSVHERLVSVSQTIRLEGFQFLYVTTLSPKRDASGAIVELNPQSRYAKAADHSLHDYGQGSFCIFRISVPKGMAGVYALVVSGSVQYIGECKDLAIRFGPGGYGTIYPRNCYVGGQSTNCKINQRVLHAAKVETSIDLHFYPTPQRKLVEQSLIRNLTPPWNSRL